MGRLRFGEEERFPYDAYESWYIVITLVNGKLVAESFRRNDGLALLDKISKLLENKEQVLVLGVWHGRYRTDAFELKPVILKKHLKEITKNWNK